MVRKIHPWTYVHAPKDVVKAWNDDSMVVEVSTGIVCTPRGWGEIYCRLTARYRRTYKFRQYAIVPKPTYERFIHNEYIEKVPQEVLRKMLIMDYLVIAKEAQE